MKIPQKCCRFFQDLKEEFAVFRKTLARELGKMTDTSLSVNMKLQPAGD